MAMPLSTPLKPMKARAKRPAVTRAMGMPSIPLGMRTRLSCSRRPANTMSDRAKPSAVARAKMMPVMRLASRPWAL